MPTISEVVRDAMNKAVKDGDVSLYAIAAKADTTWPTVKSFARGGAIKSPLLDKIAEIVGVTAKVSSGKPKA